MYVCVFNHCYLKLPDLQVKVLEIERNSLLSCTHKAKNSII